MAINIFIRTAVVINRHFFSFAYNIRSLKPISHWIMDVLQSVNVAAHIVANERDGEPHATEIFLAVGISLSNKIGMG